MPIFDSHAHYLDDRFNDDREELLATLLNTTVCGIIENGTDAATSRLAVELAHRHEKLWAAVGIHPGEAAEAVPQDLAVLEALAADKKVVAIGEIGLDYHYDDACPRDVQQHWFRSQLELANRLALPVVVHDREAHEDTLRFLQEYRPAGVVHCFSGSVEMAKEILKLGMYIGLGGVVTFKNARKTVEVAAMLPFDRLLLETDAPYLAPVPHRGERCDASHIAYTAAVIAELRGIPTEELLNITADNARRLYRL